MLNNENNIDKKVKYGFKRDLIGTERPNLFVNIKSIVKKTNNITSVTNRNDDIPNYINNIKQHEIHNLDNVFALPQHNSLMMAMQNNQSSITIKEKESSILPSDKSDAPILSDIIYDSTNTDVYIINNIHGGGTLKYKKDIKAKYTHVNFIEVPDKRTLDSIKLNVNNVLFVQQLLFSDMVPRDILNLKYKYGSKLIISVHDFCWITDVLNNYPKEPYYHWSYLVPNIKVHQDIIELFTCADLIIHPSYFTYETYGKWFPTDNFIVSYHNDYYVDYSTKRIPPIINHQINIGVLHEYMEYKGSEVISYLVENITQYKGYKLNYRIAGKTINIYQEEEFYEYVERYNIHFLLLLNKWGETYCYSLTKYINSGLPILYNNIGACKYRVPQNVVHYKKVIDNEAEYNNINKVIGKKMTEMLDYIIKENGKYNKENPSTIIYYSPLFENLFSIDVRRINYSNVHKKVKPFCIYFPQFHTLAENNNNYYSGMTDITNLVAYLKENVNCHDLMTPSKEILNLSELIKYDLTNSMLIQRQVDIAKTFGIYGFAVYYYWFSINSITNRHLIMENCFNRFFNGSVKFDNNFKVYFIWANEDWSNNPAFNTQEKIYNVYDGENFKSNIKTLIKYFKHIHYYKIHNKPVFYVHHPWKIPTENLYLFRKMLNEECIAAGFNGVNLVVNNMYDQYDNKYQNLNKYTHNPDYKKSPPTTNYLEHVKENRNNVASLNYPASMFFDFNNTARLYIPNKLDKVTIIYNNTYQAQAENLELLLTRYKSKREEINKIMLFNSWNEWGENMAIEPSTEKGYTYLNMIKFALLRFM